ncbi:BON domain [Solimicrobium silvestre]|uniref:BON domain n=2 Tax=Solimicrobium silvestre TaxID=2099400 RepID=A0A2S9GUM0_9BURK|nr:BON domain [Solimicrobium silvestre]
MKPKFGTMCVLVGSLLTITAVAYADDVDQHHPMTFIKDSAITSLIKTKLAAEHLSTLKNIKVDTDDKGVVWLSGYAPSQMLVDKSESIARNTDGVRAVKNNIVVKMD